MATKIEDMTAEERKAWLDEYRSSAPRRHKENDRFVMVAALSMVGFLVGLMLLLVIASVISSVKAS